MGPPSSSLEEVWKAGEVTAKRNYTLRPSMQEHNLKRGNSMSNRNASEMLRRILTCRAVDANESALRHITRREASTGQLAPIHYNPNSMNRRKTEARMNGGKRVAGEKAAYRPVGTPNCSQCGEAFRPEKLYSHMQVCKGLKARLRGDRCNQDGIGLTTPD